MAKKKAETLGEIIKRMRLARGLTQCELAAKLEVNQVTVSGWETDRRRPAGIVDLAQVLGCRPVVLWEAP